MAVSLREVLELEPLRQARPSVLAGREHLDRAVRWVHVTELPDIGHLLRGGELILTTGMGIAGSHDLQRRHVAELVEAGVVGVIVELGRNFDHLPHEMVECAESAGLPLVALERETRFVEVTEAVHREIINRQFQLLQRAEDVSRELTELILMGAELGRIVGRLAEIFDNHVVLEDEAHQVVEIAGPNEGSDVLSRWDMHARVGHEEVSRGTVHHHDGSPRCQWVTLWLRHGLWGRLHVLETKNRLGGTTELLVDRAGAALSLALLLEKDAARLADRARSALVGEVAAGRYGSADEFLRRARSLGADLRTGRLVVLALETLWSTGERPTDSEGLGRAEATEEARRVAVRAAIAGDIRQAATERACGALVGLMDARVLAVLSVPGGRALSTVLEEIVKDTLSRVAETDDLVTLIAGASREAVTESLPTAVEEAVAALALGQRRGDGRAVYHFTDLGMFQLLIRLAEGPELARFVEAELHALLDHDARSRTRLLPTLRAYLGHAGRKADTVRALGIQRRTLYARLERLEALLGRDLDQEETRTSLNLALCGLDLLQDRRRPSPTGGWEELDSKIVTR